MPCVYVSKPTQPTHSTRPTHSTQPTKPTEKPSGLTETELLEFAVGAAIVGGALYLLLKR